MYVSSVTGRFHAPVRIVLPAVGGVLREYLNSSMVMGSLQYRVAVAQVLGRSLNGWPLEWPVEVSDGHTAVTAEIAWGNLDARWSLAPLVFATIHECDHLLD